MRVSRHDPTRNGRRVTKARIVSNLAMWKCDRPSAAQQDGLSCFTCGFVILDESFRNIPCSNADLILACGVWM